MTRALRVDRERARARRIAGQREAVRARAQAWRWSPEEAARRARQEQRRCIGGFAVTGVDEGPIGSPDPVFAPSDVAGYRAHWNSDNVALGAGLDVTSILDVSGNMAPLVASATTSRRPVLGFDDVLFNGFPSLTWSNADATWVGTDTVAILIGDLTLFQFFYNPASVGSYLYALSGGDYWYADNAFSVYHGDRGGGSFGGLELGSGWAIDPAGQTLALIQDGTLAGLKVYKNDDGAALSGSQVGGDQGSTGTNNYVSIMNYTDASNLTVSMDCRWVETILYDQAVSDADRIKIRNWGKAKYLHY